MMESRKMDKIYMSFTHTGVKELYDQLDKNIFDDLKSVATSGGISAIGLIPALAKLAATSPLTFIGGLFYSITTIIPSAEDVIADKLKDFIFDMNRDENAVIGFDIDIVYATMTAYINDEPTSIDLKRIMYLENTGTHLWDATELEALYN